MRPNAKRKARLHERNFTGPFPAGDHAMDVRKGGGCFRCTKDRVEAAHVAARGMGGCGCDWSGIIRLCIDCHGDYDAHRFWTPEQRESAHWEAHRLALESLESALYYAENEDQREHYATLFDASWIAQWAKRRET